MPDRSGNSSVIEQAPYGIWGCGVKTGSGQVAIIVTWLTQLSFNPTLIGISLETDGPFLRHLVNAGEFTVSALPKDQGKAIARKILKAGMNQGARDHAGLFRIEPGWQEAIGGALGAMTCRVSARHACGDHTLVVAEVIAEHRWHRGEALQLRDTGWKYRRPVPVKDHSTTD